MKSFSHIAWLLALLSWFAFASLDTFHPDTANHNIPKCIDSFHKSETVKLTSTIGGELSSGGTVSW